jgi:hypothetical protein
MRSLSGTEAYLHRKFIMFLKNLKIIILRMEILI